MPRYPLLADPTVQLIDQQVRVGDDFETDPRSRGWSYFEGTYVGTFPNGYSQPQNTPYEGFWGAFFGPGSGGFYTQANAGSWPSNSHGIWAQNVPNLVSPHGTTAYFNYAKFESPAFSISGGGSFPGLDFGTFSPSTNLYLHRVSWYGQKSQPEYWIGPTNDRRAQEINFELHSGPNSASLGASQSRYGFLGGMVTYIADGEPPTVSQADQPPPYHQWTNQPSSSAVFPFKTKDDGLGVAAVHMKAGMSPETAPVTIPFGGYCAGWNAAQACPQRPEPAFSYDQTGLAQGINKLYGRAVDVLGKDSGYQPLGRVLIDKGGPDVTVSGGLKNLDAPGRDLHVEATDGSPDSDAMARSGVVRATLVVDDPEPGDPSKTKTLFDRTQPNWDPEYGTYFRSSAPLSADNQDFTLRRSDNVQNGQRHFKLTVRDEAGNETVREWDQMIKFAPEIELSGSLEDASDNDYDVDGPTRLDIKATPAGESAVTDLKAEVSKNGGSFEEVWDLHKDCTDSQPCALSEQYFHFPERFGRGDIELRITARDAGGATKSTTIAFHQDEPRTGELRQFTFEDFPINDRQIARVNVANGNLLLEANDIEIAGTGLNNTLMRSYNSLDSRAGGEFGKGWSFSTATGLCLEEQPNGDVWFLGPSGYRVLFEKRNDGSYNDPVGIDAKLKEEDSGDFELELSQSEERYEFNDAGDLLKHVDKNDHAISFERQDGKIQKIIDTQGTSAGLSADHELNFTHDNGKVTRIVDGAGREWKYEYAGGLMTKYTDPSGFETDYEYDGHDRLEAVIDPLNNRTEIEYLGKDDNQGRAVRVIRQDANDNDDDGESDFETTYEHDVQANSSCAKDGEDPADYEGKRIMSTSTDPLAHKTTYCNDPKTQVDRTEDARGLTTQGEYNPRGNIQSYSRGDAGSSGSATLSYDSSNRLDGTTTDTGSGSVTTALGYEQGNTSFRPDTATDAQGNTRGFSYDGAGNLTSITGNDGTADQSVITLDRYDDGDPDYLPILKGLVRRSKVEVGPPSDPDSDLAKTRYTYNGDGDIEKVEPPNPQGAIFYETDIPNRISQITDARGNTRQIFYDKVDRITEIRYESEEQGVAYRFTRFDYDGNGNLKSRTEGRKLEDASEDELQVDTFDYDARNQITGDHLRGGAQHNYEYDRAGNLVRLVSSPGDDQNEQVTTYEYNQVNLVTRVWEPGADISNDNAAIRYEYEDENQSKPKSNNLLSITFPGSVEQRFTRDKADRITEIQVQRNPQTQNPQTLVHLKWDYGDGGLRESMTDELRGSDGMKTTYVYDYMNRLTCAEENNGGDIWRYAYNNASEMLRSDHDPAADFACGDTEAGDNRVGYDHNDAHEITSRDGKSYDYDEQGNLNQIEDGLGFSYNTQNQTIRISGTPGGPFEMTYAGPGQDDRLTAGENHYTRNALGLGYQTEDTLRTDFTRDDAGNPIGLRRDTERYYLLTDSIGSVIGIVDGDGGVAASYRYDPYGNTTFAGGPGGNPAIQNPIRFAGYDLDQPTGLYKAGARYYDPVSTTWTQKDPLSQVADPNQANPYAYSGANPVNNTDPSGATYCTMQNGYTCFWPGSDYVPPRYYGGSTGFTWPFTFSPESALCTIVSGAYSLAARGAGGGSPTTFGSCSTASPYYDPYPDA